MTEIAVLTQGVRVVELVACLAVTVRLGRRWRRDGSPATRAAFAVFGLLVLLLSAGWYHPADSQRGLGLVTTRALLVLLLALPYLLVRFAAVLGAVSSRAHRVAAAAYGVQVVVTVLVPALPAPQETARPGWVVGYVVLVLLVWSGQSGLVAVGLWRAGRATSSMVRHRMRSLATGAVVLAVSLVVTGAVGNSPPPAVQVVLLLAGLGSVLLFAVAFVVPPALRAVWRQDDLAALAEAERGLMTALSPRDVAATLVPALGSVFGGSAAVLDAAGRPLRPERVGAPDVVWLARLLPPHAPAGPGVRQVAPGVFAARLQDGWLAVRTGRLAPVFGDDDAVLLDRVATLLDLALQRVTLHERETASRRAAEAANDDLETLLYSVSHDLRSPLISVLGYLDVLRGELGAALTGDGAHYLERMTVNALYMQSLIRDLLELSRIRPSGPTAEAVDLHAVAGQVADAARLAHPGARIDVVGRLPVVRMSDVRVRQLLTNLVDNALVHGGRDDVHVTVRARTDMAGDLLVEVADDGRGVPAQYRHRVLGVFERLDAPKSSPGTGMGLAICKRIVDTAGGSVTVDGPPAGAATGTTVRLTLPGRAIVTAGGDRLGVAEAPAAAAPWPPGTGPPGVPGVPGQRTADLAESLPAPPDCLTSVEDTP